MEIAGFGLILGLQVLIGLSVKAKFPKRSESRLYFKGLSIVRLSIPAIFLCKQDCFTM